MFFSVFSKMSFLENNFNIYVPISVGKEKAEKIANILKNRFESEDVSVNPFHVACGNGIDSMYDNTTTNLKREVHNGENFGILRGKDNAHSETFSFYDEHFNVMMEELETHTSGICDALKPVLGKTSIEVIDSLAPRTEPNKIAYTNPATHVLESTSVNRDVFEVGFADYKKQNGSIQHQIETAMMGDFNTHEYEKNKVLVTNTSIGDDHHNPEYRPGQQIPSWWVSHENLLPLTDSKEWKSSNDDVTGEDEEDGVTQTTTNNENGYLLVTRNETATVSKVDIPNHHLNSGDQPLDSNAHGNKILKTDSIREKHLKTLQESNKWGTYEQSGSTDSSFTAYVLYSKPGDGIAPDHESPDHREPLVGDSWKYLGLPNGTKWDDLKRPDQKSMQSVIKTTNVLRDQLNTALEDWDTQQSIATRMGIYKFKGADKDQILFGETSSSDPQINVSGINLGQFYSALKGWPEGLDNQGNAMPKRESNDGYTVPYGTYNNVPAGNVDDRYNLAKILQLKYDSEDTPTDQYFDVLNTTDSGGRILYGKNDRIQYTDDVNMNHLKVALTNWFDEEKHFPLDTRSDDGHNTEDTQQVRVGKIYSDLNELISVQRTGGDIEELSVATLAEQDNIAKVNISGIYRHFLETETSLASLGDDLQAWQRMEGEYESGTYDLNNFILNDPFDAAAPEVKYTILSGAPTPELTHQVQISQFENAIEYFTDSPPETISDTERESSITLGPDKVRNIFLSDDELRPLHAVFKKVLAPDYDFPPEERQGYTPGPGPFRSPDGTLTIDKIDLEGDGETRYVAIRGVMHQNPGKYAFPVNNQNNVEFIRLWLKNGQESLHYDGINIVSDDISWGVKHDYVTDIPVSLALSDAHQIEFVVGGWYLEGDVYKPQGVSTGSEGGGWPAGSKGAIRAAFTVGDLRGLAGPPVWKLSESVIWTKSEFINFPKQVWNGSAWIDWNKAIFDNVGAWPVPGLRGTKLRMGGKVYQDFLCKRYYTEGTGNQVLYDAFFEKYGVRTQYFRGDELGINASILVQASSHISVEYSEIIADSQFTFMYRENTNIPVTLYYDGYKDPATIRAEAKQKVDKNIGYNFKYRLRHILNVDDDTMELKKTAERQKKYTNSEQWNVLVDNDATSSEFVIGEGDVSGLELKFAGEDVDTVTRTFTELKDLSDTERYSQYGQYTRVESNGEWFDLTDDWISRVALNEISIQNVKFETYTSSTILYGCNDQIKASNLVGVNQLETALMHWPSNNTDEKSNNLYEILLRHGALNGTFSDGFLLFGGNNTLLKTDVSKSALEHAFEDYDPTDSVTKNLHARFFHLDHTDIGDKVVTCAEGQLRNTAVTKQALEHAFQDYSLSLKTSLRERFYSLDYGTIIGDKIVRCHEGVFYNTNINSAALEHAFQDYSLSLKASLRERFYSLDYTNSGDKIVRCHEGVFYNTNITSANFEGALESFIPNGSNSLVQVHQKTLGLDESINDVNHRTRFQNEMGDKKLVVFWDGQKLTTGTEAGDMSLYHWDNGTGISYEDLKASNVQGAVDRQDETKDAGITLEVNASSALHVLIHTDKQKFQKYISSLSSDIIHANSIEKYLSQWTAPDPGDARYDDMRLLPESDPPEYPVLGSFWAPYSASNSSPFT